MRKEKTRSSRLTVLSRKFTLHSAL
ncbi:hypothetical protein X777_00339 [Ooceraea biroi]|uniref:Uncharacterized protein n=1 Tax=Ooceraea biroi TaxID=2015173 RepID=A0A026WV08_OOCBI|nr:hypothetical protein X777_00339 [Ooceraea biroi]